MKKIFMLVLCCLMAMPAFGANSRSCPERSSLQLQGAQNGKDNEFVYTNRETYELVADCYKNRQNGKNCTLDNKGFVYECDTEHGCKGDTYLFGENGWIHTQRQLFGGTDARFENVENKILLCVTSPDSWHVSDYDDCPENTENWTNIKFQNPTTKQCYWQSTGGGRKYCCKNVSGKQPKQPTQNQDSKDCAAQGGTWHEAEIGPSICICKDGKAWQNKKCPANNKSCDGTEHGKSKTEKCPSKIVGGNMCQRTCNDGNWSAWKIISCDTTQGYEEKPKNNKCVKKSGGGNDDDGGVVAPVEDPVESFTCPGLTPSDWRTKYAKCDNVIAAYTALEEYCADEPIKDEYNKKWTELKKLASACDDKMSRITRSTATITTAAQNLDALIGNKVSAWKNAEGEFNTARLASDSIAGVVLGTAGGLITSHLVKKGQVKQGFEDISCTVGGQRVADWGDEFTVGIR